MANPFFAPVYVHSMHTQLPFLFANTKSEAAVIERQVYAAQHDADCAALDLVAAKCPSVVAQLLLSVLDDLLARANAHGLGARTSPNRHINALDSTLTCGVQPSHCRRSSPHCCCL